MNIPYTNKLSETQNLIEMDNPSSVRVYPLSQLTLLLTVFILLVTILHLMFVTLLSNITYSHNNNINFMCVKCHKP